MNILITGGCGFIGCNAAQRFLRLGHEVTVLDNLSRSGSAQNLTWLRSESLKVPSSSEQLRPGKFNFVERDIRNSELLSEEIRTGKFDVCLHLAAQVAVTTSVVDPRTDFEINALGTFNLLEAIRIHSPQTIVLNASTNKVYGKLSAVRLKEEAQRYVLPDLPNGVTEEQQLDFHSPYGCSKGTADQYVNDYARIYGLRTVNFRQSCIYGYRQFGVEDQGWVAWFTIAHALGMPVSIYGTGKQVRDILFIDDLIDCYLRAVEAIDRVSGMTFNIGGGPQHTLSLLELLDLLESTSGQPLTYRFEEWRPGDQPVYISNVNKAEEALSWKPQIDVKDGFERLYSWVRENRSAFAARAAL